MADCTDCAALKARLADAEAAYHRLMTGKAVARAKDQNGEEVQYTMASKTQLAAYIASLRQQIAVSCDGNRAASGPMRVWGT